MKVSAFVQGIVFWPSLGLIQPVILNALQKKFRNLKVYNFLETNLSPSVDDDFWIFLPGTVRKENLDWLKTIPVSKRPPIIFFLNGEGAKLAYHLYYYRDFFSSQDVWSVACDSEKRLIDSWFKGNQRTFITHYPVDTKIFNPKNSRGSNWDLPKNKQLVLYAGRLSYQKNILSLFDFLFKNPDLHLVLCGDADTMGLPHFPGKANVHYASQLFTAIKKFGLVSCVSFVTYQSQNDLAKLMNQCDYQISLSSHYGEDFGYSIAQGLCCGLKTVLSYWGGHINWKESVSKKSLSYIDLNWKNRSLGFPIIPAKSMLPQSNPVGFAENYSLHFERQFDTMIEQMLSSKGFSVISSLEVSQYWKNKSSNPTSALFDSHKDSMFLKVIKAYKT